jgi:DNA mismatch endonuclease (patch repair protein)
MDSLSVAERSRRMALIRSKDTKPERIVRSLIHGLGYRYRLHRRDLPGVPDLVFPGRKKIIFVHGCFWHAHENCKIANRPKSRRAFWNAKFKRNKLRDIANERRLRRDGWSVSTVWECETRAPELIAAKVVEFLGRRARRKRRHG